MLGCLNQAQTNSLKETISYQAQFHVQVVEDNIYYNHGSTFSRSCNQNISSLWINRKWLYMRSVKSGANINQFGPSNKPKDTDWRLLIFSRLAHISYFHKLFNHYKKIVNSISWGNQSFIYGLRLICDWGT